MKRVAGRRAAHGPVPPTSELPFIRFFAPNDHFITPEVATAWAESIAGTTGRKWAIARENDLYVRLYLLPEITRVR